MSTVLDVAVDAAGATGNGGTPCILFQSHNRRGLGHLMRSLNVARELRELAAQARIVVHSRNPSAGRFCPRDVEWILDDGADRGWHATLRDVHPDVVVYDTLVPAEPEREPIPPGARVVYVMRRCTDERHQAIAQSAFLDRVDLAVVPHERHEFDHAVPERIAGRTVFAGPIVRSPDPARRERLRDRYGLASARQVIVSSAGAGGFADTAGPFFDAVWDAHERLRAGADGLRHVVVLGPHNDDARTALPGMTVVASEPDLVDLFSLADLVVSEGGYNSVNEIRRVGVAACFVPGRRRWDDQTQRVRALEADGLAAVAIGDSPRVVGAQIAAVARDPRRLSDLRRRSRDHALEPGNRRAAQAILDLT